MPRVETLVGAGQAGLAISRCLTERGTDHVVVERGQVAERWRTARWDSLRLITPNWMSRLPAWSYSGTDPHGYMAAPELVSYLQEYADSFAAPLHENTTVELVEASASGLRVVTDQRTWLARNVVVATGTENRAYVPSVASGIDPGVHQLTASRYQGPRQIPDGGVLVIGASASGVQIADELRRSGRPVTISVGRHSRIPRSYRGRDILWWMHQAGILDRTIDEMRDARSARSAPSLQLSGRNGHRVGLETLTARGVPLAGRLVAADGRSLTFADDLPATTATAQARMERLLRSQHYDVVVAGARCAGAATAMLLARQGARVPLLDRSRYGTDTLSTHALMRGAVLQLHRWGLLPRVIAARTPAVRSTTFHLPGAASTVEIKPKHGVDALYAPRRVVLDAILADAARSAGADVRFGTSVTGLRRDRTWRVAGITARAGAAHLEVSADLVVGADGRRSTVARYVGAGAAHVAAASSAVIYRHDEPAQPRRPAAVNPAIPADTLPLTRRHPVQQNTRSACSARAPTTRAKPRRSAVMGLGGCGARMGGHGRRCSFAVDRFRR